MDTEAQHIKYLIIVTAMLCAVIIGYSAFYVPDAKMSEVIVKTDTDAEAPASGEEYTPAKPDWSTGGASHSTDVLSSRSTTVGASFGEAAGTAKQKVNINTAGENELASSLDGVGEVLAGRIVGYREKNGKFKSIEDIKKVSGMGDKKFENIKDNITVG